MGHVTWGLAVLLQSGTGETNDAVDMVDDPALRRNVGLSPRNSKTVRLPLRRYGDSC